MAKIEKFKKYSFTYIFSLLLFSCFVILAAWIAANPVNSFDRTLLLSLQNLSNPLLDQFMINISFFGETLVAIVLVLVLSVALFVQKRKSSLILICLALLIFLSADFFKLVFVRPRPDIFLVSGYSLPSSFSFPSGHVTFYTIYFGFLLFLAINERKFKKLMKVLVVASTSLLIILIGYSRVYLGVHWPTDVIGGYLLGFSLLLPFLTLYLELDKPS